MGAPSIGFSLTVGLRFGSRAQLRENTRTTIPSSSVSLGPFRLTPVFRNPPLPKGFRPIMDRWVIDEANAREAMA